MHTTTVRFMEDDWNELTIYCESRGISKGQFIRESSIARLAVLNHNAAVRTELMELDDRLSRVERWANRIRSRAPFSGG